MTVSLRSSDGDAASVLPDAEDDDARPTDSGAPVEKNNPLGREVTLLSAVMLNLGQILGSNIFSVPGVVLNSLGSIALFFGAWLLAPLLAYGGLMIYTELSAMFPNRSGASVVYLEQAYTKPKFLVPVVFAVTSVLLSYSATNAIVFAQYSLAGLGIPVTPMRQTVVAVGVSTLATASACLSTKWSLKAVNVLSIFKVLSLAFVVMVGIVVLAGGTRIEEPFAHFRHPFKGSVWNANALATSLIKTNSAFAGWHNAFNVLAEVRHNDPVRIVSRAGYLSLTIVLVLYVFTNVAYIAAVSPEAIAGSGQLVGALFFRNVFGDSASARILPLMVAGSCLGNIIATIVGSARVLREIARQGLLPYPSLFSSTKPFGTPLFPILLKYGMSVLVIVLLPAKDAFNFLMDLATYPSLIFGLATTIGVWILRKKRAQAGLPPAPHRAWDIVVIISILWHALLLVMPWVPPTKGHSDVSFWYATYCVVGIAVLLVSAAYYYVWIVLLPKRGGYDVVEEVQELDDGARNVRLVRRYNLGQQDTVDEEEPLLP